MSRDVFVCGVGMIPFTKPGANEPYPQMGAYATRAALQDAGIGYEQGQQAYVGYVYGDSTSGCSTGSTALFLARQAVASGAAECVLALGFEQMNPGALGAVFEDRPSPFERFDAATNELVQSDLPLALRYFAGAGKAHMDEFGTPLETFAKIRAKASRHAANNPLAVFRTVVTEQEVMQAKMLWPGVLTRLMACPPTCGAAAAIVCSAAFAQTFTVSCRAPAIVIDWVRYM